jgi:hypothetical protein
LMSVRVGERTITLSTEAATKLVVAEG